MPADKQPFGVDLTYDLLRQQHSIFIVRDIDIDDGTSYVIIDTPSRDINTKLQNVSFHPRRFRLVPTIYQRH